MNLNLHYCKALASHQVAVPVHIFSLTDTHSCIIHFIHVTPVALCTTHDNGVPRLYCPLQSCQYPQPTRPVQPTGAGSLSESTVLSEHSSRALPGTAWASLLGTLANTL